ncbi:MAG: hypothetical protein C4299_01020 [Thermoleophilia bacterium]
MRPRGSLLLIGLLGATLLAAPSSASSRSPRPVHAEAALSPRIVLFGDTVAARVEVTLDSRRADPDSVVLRPDFLPWEPVSPPVVERRRAGALVVIRATYRLRCLTGPCVPPRDTALLELSPLRVSYGERGSIARRRVLLVTWPVLVVHTRIVGLDFRRPDALARPWTADLDSLPAVSYRLDPGTGKALVLALSSFLAAGGLALVGVSVSRRGSPASEASDPAQPAASPLERALAVLEGADGEDGLGERRRALELVAGELSRRGEESLARAARGLAWSKEGPRAQQARELAGRLRAALERGRSDVPP